MLSYVKGLSYVYKMEIECLLDMRSTMMLSTSLLVATVVDLLV